MWQSSWWKVLVFSKWNGFHKYNGDNMCLFGCTELKYLNALVMSTEQFRVCFSLPSEKLHNANQEVIHYIKI